MGFKITWWRKLQPKIYNLLSVLGIVLFAYFVFRFGHKYYHLNYHGRQTYGTIELIGEDWRYDKEVRYSYTIDGKKYYGRAWYDDKIKPKIGETFRVKYSSQNPEISKLLLRGK